MLVNFSESKFDFDYQKFVGKAKRPKPFDSRFDPHISSTLQTANENEKYWRDIATKLIQFNSIMKNRLDLSDSCPSKTLHSSK